MFSPTGRGLLGGGEDGGGAGGDKQVLDSQNSHCIHVILAWNEIGRSAIFGREIEVPDREVFSRRNKINFSGKNCYFQHCR